MGTLLASYRYDIFGESKTTNIIVNNPYKYSAEAKDSSTGLQYLRARYYDAQKHRFITKDTYQGETQTPLSRNGYAYVHNNPVNFQDPSGHIAFTTVVTVVGIVITVGVLARGIYEHHKQSKPIKKEKDKKNKEIKEQEKKADKVEKYVYDYMKPETCQNNLLNGRIGNGKYRYTYTDLNKKQRKVVTFAKEADYLKYKKLCKELEKIDYKKNTLDNHFALDMLGSLPGVGSAFDAINGVLYASEGKTLDAALSFAAAIPFGEIAKGFKGLKGTGKAIGIADDVADIGAKNADDVVGNGVKSGSTVAEQA